MIEHLVFSGGGNIGFIYIGILKYLFSENKIQMESIKSIHCTSIGSLAAVMLSLLHTVDDIEEYIVNRPWHNLFEFTISTVLEAIRSGGMYNMNPLRKCFEPLFLAKELSVETTLAELYRYNSIDIHFYSSDLITFDLIDISHKTHPHWTVLEAIYASSALPIVFTPLKKEGKVLIDGALFCNYPLKPCLNYGHDPDTIMGFNIESISKYNSTSEYLLLDYLNMIIIKMWNRTKVDQSEELKKVENQFLVHFDFTIDSTIKSLNSKEERERLILLGIAHACFRGEKTS